MHITRSDLVTQAQPGDLIGFTSGGLVGHTIRLAAKLSDPSVRYADTWSHVGIVYFERQNRRTMVESTTKNTVPDLTTGKMRKGVSLVDLEDRINSFDGKLWWRPMHRWLEPDKLAFAHAYMQVMGRSYENLLRPSGLWSLVDAELFDHFNIGDEADEGRRLSCGEMVVRLAKEAVPELLGDVVASQTSPTNLGWYMKRVWRAAPMEVV